MFGRRFLVLFLFALLSVVLLSACGGKTTPTPTPTATALAVPRGWQCQPYDEYAIDCKLRSMEAIVGPGYVTIVSSGKPDMVKLRELLSYKGCVEPPDKKLKPGIFYSVYCAR